MPGAEGRLTVLMQAFEGGGAQRDMVLLCNGLRARGTIPIVLALREEGPLRALLDPAIAVTGIAGGRMRYAVPGLRAAIKAARPAALVGSEAGLNLFCLAAVASLPKRLRPKLVLREVGSPSIAERRDPHVQNRIAYRLLHRFYRRADRVVTLTAGARDDLIRNFAVLPERIAAMETNAVITPGVAAELAAWDGEGGREADLVVSVGRLSPEKNQRLLLRAMALGHGQRRWRLAFVGDGPERQALAKLAAELGLSDRVQFAGYVADPFAWTKRPAVLASSSTYEGLGNAIIEALACGTPVVSTDCPYGPAEILEHGRYGTLVPLDDAERMAEAIAAALERPVDRKHLMARGLNYTQERAAERFQAIIAGL